MGYGAPQLSSSGILTFLDVFESLEYDEQTCEPRYFTGRYFSDLDEVRSFDTSYEDLRNSNEISGCFMSFIILNYGNKMMDEYIKLKDNNLVQNYREELVKATTYNIFIQKLSYDLDSICLTYLYFTDTMNNLCDTQQDILKSLNTEKIYMNQSDFINIVEKYNLITRDWLEVINIELESINEHLAGPKSRTIYYGHKKLLLKASETINIFQQWVNL